LKNPTARPGGDAKGRLFVAKGKGARQRLSRKKDQCGQQIRRRKGGRTLLRNVRGNAPRGKGVHPKERKKKKKRRGGEENLLRGENPGEI